MPRELGGGAGKVGLNLVNVSHHTFLISSVASKHHMLQISATTATTGVILIWLAGDRLPT